MGMGSWLGSTVSTAVKPLYDGFIEHATYLFTTRRNVRDLETNTRTFVGLRDDLQQQLQTGRRNGLVETKGAVTWLQRANKAITDEERNRNRYEQRCKIFGCCVPNCLSNYKIGKKAAKTLVEVNLCREQRPTTVTAEPPPRPVLPIQVETVSLKASQVSILNQALRCIKDDDATVGLIGIWGSRGIGKTLLLKMINNSFGASTDTREDPNHSSTSEQTGDIGNRSTSSEIIQEEETDTGRCDKQESLFQFVIYVMASRNCTVENIQSEIMRRLKIEVQDGDLLTTRACRITSFLLDKSFLVLLDGLENVVDLAAVGIPHPLGVHGQLTRKVLITTKTQALCHRMQVNRYINVPGLQMDEALELFKESAGGDNIYSNPNISAPMEALVKMLRVLPTELINFGRDMRGKEDPRQWQNVIHVIKELMKIQEREATSLREGIDKKLTEDVKKLREERRDVGNKIELAKGNDMVATKKIETWLDRADTIISEPTEVNMDISIAAAKLREVRECLNDPHSDIVQPPSVMHITVHDVLLPSQVLFVERARQYIINDPEGMTVISGPEGVGKTLLLNMINNSFETGNCMTPGSSNRGNPPFDFVIYLTASEGCSVGNIQSDIMQRLKMQDGGDSVITRATKISNFLQDRCFLVLLDGLETYLDLAEVGLPPLGIRGNLNKKVVVTTRSERLFAQMRASRAMKVSGLDMDEALQLFEQIVGCENLYSNPRIGEHAKDIVDERRARPSELIKFGKELCGIEEPKQWEDAILKQKEYWKQPSRAKVFTEAMEYVKSMEYIKDDKQVDVIGIWGPGGVGKTHLLEKIKDQADSLFDHVISVTASRGCSVEKIQRQIVNKLNLGEPHGEQNQDKTIISGLLEGKSFLLLLDDVWNQIDLKAVGIPYSHGSVAQPRRKVVLTTRLKKVCGQMEVRKEISVPCLPHDEAWRLFQDKVGQGTLSSSPRIEALAKELAQELKGLPLALITIGRAMYGKSDPTQWESAINYMKQSCCVGDDQDLDMENVFRRLMFSYDNLRNDTLRECFLTCSLWPEDEEIFTEDLIRCWIGCLVAECGDIHASYRKAHSLIGELTAACLIESCETSVRVRPYVPERRYHSHQVMPNKACVKMHDVMRDMAIWISCGCGDNKDKWVVRAGVGANVSVHTIPWSRAECISIMCNNIEELPPVRMSSSPTRLKKLYLRMNSLDERIFGAILSFTELTYLDLSWNEVTVIPEELCALVNLEHLDLSSNRKLRTVPTRLRELTKLKFLYLGGTDIPHIPKEVISSLRELQVVELMTPIDDTSIVIEELCTLTNLKAVDIFIDGDDGYESLGKAAGIPFRDLVISGLEETRELCLAVDTLTGDIAGTTLNELHVGHCKMEQIIVGDELGKPFDALSMLVLQYLVNLTNIKFRKGASSQALFPSLTRLSVICCNQLQDLSWTAYLPCLEHLEVVFCVAMKQICMGASNHGVNRYRGEGSSNTFPCLKYLGLYGNSELSSLCGSNVTFPCLEHLCIKRCPALRRLPFTMQSLLHKLTTLGMSDEDWKILKWEDEGVRSFLQQFRVDRYIT